MAARDSQLATCVHGLKFDATQHVGCVVCRRERGLPSTAPAAAGAAAPPASRTRAAYVVYGAIVLLVGAVGMGLLARRLIRDRNAVAEVASEVAPLAQGVENRGSEPARAPDTPAGSEVAAAQARDAPTTAAPPAAEDSPALEAERRRVALDEARRDVSVTLYTTSWCPYCVRAKAYMDQNDIRYVEHDVEADPSARAARDRLNPRGSVPTFDIDGTALVGFSAQALERTIASAAESRL